MPKRWTHTAAFNHFGTEPRNVQWSWSARSADGKTVVVTLWQDRFKRQNGSLYYQASFAEEVRRRPGFTELMDNLGWVRDHCHGMFRVIIAIAKDKNADPRSIAECFPSPMTMRLIEFDVEAGYFLAAAVDQKPS